MRLIELSINRRGDFEINNDQFTSTQCGKEEKRGYKYYVKITGSNVALDSQGFLIDNMIVDKYFQDTYVRDKKACQSCETMACDAVDYFCELFRKEYEKVYIKSIYVELHGSDHSFITGSWINS